MAGKRFKIHELPVEKLCDQVEIDIEVPVDKHVAETGDIPEVPREITGQHSGLGEPVDGGCIIRSVQAGGQRHMGSNIEAVLRTELEAAFDRPAQIGILSKLSRGRTGMPAQVFNGESQGGEMAPHDGGIRLSGGHLPSGEPEPHAASIFASWGTKSQ